VVPLNGAPIDPNRLSLHQEVESGNLNAGAAHRNGVNKAKHTVAKTENNPGEGI